MLKSVEMQASVANSDEITVSADKPSGKAVGWAANKVRDRFNRQHNPAQMVRVKRAGYHDVLILCGDNTKDKLRQAWTVEHTQPDDLSEPVPVETHRGEYAGGCNLVPNIDYGAAVSVPALVVGAQEPPEGRAEPDYDKLADVCRRTPVLDLAKVKLPAHLSGYKNNPLLDCMRSVWNLTHSETLIAALSYAGNGWPVIPWRFVKDREGKQRKVPCVAAWNTAGKSTDPHKLAQWFDDGEFFGIGQFKDAYAGIVCGATNAGYELVVLDVDVKNEKNGFIPLAALVDKYGTLPDTLTQDTPSGGKHFVFRVPAGTGIYRKVSAFKELGDGLDVLGFDGFIGADFNAGYRWPNDLPVARMPDAWVKVLQVECHKDKAFGRKSVPAFDGNPETLTPEQVADVRDACQQLDMDDRKTWIAVGMSLFRYGEAGFKLWVEASSTPKFCDTAEDDCAYKWVHDNFRGEKTGRSIFEMAKAANPDWVNPATVRAEQAKAAREAQAKAARPQLIPGMDMPDYIRQLIEQKANSDGATLEAVSDEEARRVLGEFVDAGMAAPEGSEAQFIAGVLLADKSMIMPHVMKHPTRSDGKLRGIIRYADGSKPETVESIDWERVEPNLILGGSDCVTRLANNTKAKLSDRIDVKGRQPNTREAALVRRVVEISPFGLAIPEAGKLIKPGELGYGWNLESILSQGLSRANGAPEQGTGLASSGSSRGSVVDVQIPEGADWVQVYDVIMAAVRAGNLTWEQGYSATMQVVNAAFAKVMMGGKALVVRDVYDSAAKRTVYEFTPLRELSDHHAHRRLQVGENDKGKPIIKDVFTAWKAWHGCRAFNSVQFAPDNRLPKGVFNTWRGFAVEPKEGTHRLDKIMHHLEHVICAGDKAVFDYHLDWLASSFQQPQSPAGSSLVWRGKKGTGKGKMATFIKHLWGQHGVHIVDPAHLTGRFNGHMTGVCFMFADEAFFAADPQAVGILQARITEETMMVERKGIDPVQERNMLHVIMATNSDFAVPATADERRYCVVDVADEYKGDKAYFRALSADMDSEEVQAAFLYEMLKRDVSEFFASHIPETEALKDQRAHNLKTPAKWLMDCLHDGRILHYGDAVSGSSILGDNSVWPASGEASTAVLYDSYSGWCREMKVKSYDVMPRRTFSAYVYEVFPSKQVGTNRAKGVKLGTLDEAIDAFEKLEKVKVDM